MQDIEQLPLQQWAEQLKAARIGAKLDTSELAQALMLSSAQLRGLESGTLSAFHGPGYYLRAVEKYARHLNVTLDPPVTELRLTDSQIALNRVKNQPSAAKLAKRESLTLGADAMPRRHGGISSMGVWLGGLLVVLVAAGTWMAINEGWPEQDPLERAQETSQNVTIQAAPAIKTTPTPSAPQATEPASAVNQSAPLAPTPAITNQAEQPTETSTDKPTSAESVAAVAPAVSVAPAPATAPETQTTDSTVTEPAATAAASSEAATRPAPDMIQAQFDADCWVEIRFADGRVEQGIYKAGQTINLPVTDIARLTFGNAQAVSATRAGEAFDVLAFTRGGNNVARISGQDLQ